jgi:hypothetical protein
MTTHNTQNRQNIYAPGGIRTHDRNRRAAVDLRLRARGHWDRLLNLLRPAIHILLRPTNTTTFHTLQLLNHQPVGFNTVKTRPIYKYTYMYIYIYIYTYIVILPASWLRGQTFWLLAMRSWVRFPVLSWEFFLAGEDPHSDYGLGSL